MRRFLVLLDIFVFLVAAAATEYSAYPTKTKTSPYWRSIAAKMRDQQMYPRFGKRAPNDEEYYQYLMETEGSVPNKHMFHRFGKDAPSDTSDYYWQEMMEAAEEVPNKHMFHRFGKDAPPDSDEYWQEMLDAESDIPNKHMFHRFGKDAPSEGDEYWQEMMEAAEEIPNKHMFHRFGKDPSQSEDQDFWNEMMEGSITHSYGRSPKALNSDLDAWSNDDKLWQDMIDNSQDPANHMFYRVGKEAMEYWDESLDAENVPNKHMFQRFGKEVEIPDYYEEMMMDDVDIPNKNMFHRFGKDNAENEEENWQEMMESDGYVPNKNMFQRFGKSQEYASNNFYRPYEPEPPTFYRVGKENEKRPFYDYGPEGGFNGFMKKDGAEKRPFYDYDPTGYYAKKDGQPRTYEEVQMPKSFLPPHGYFRK